MWQNQIFKQRNKATKTAGGGGERQDGAGKTCKKME